MPPSKGTTTTQPKGPKKVEFKSVAAASLLQPSFTAVISWLEATAATTTTTTGSSSATAARKRLREADTADTVPNDALAELQDTLVEHLNKLHDAVAQYHRQLLPAAAHIVAHLTPLLLRKKAPVEAWELAATCSLTFGAPSGTLLKSVLEHICVEKFQHPVFSCTRRLAAFQNMLLGTYEFISSPEMSAMLGGVTMLAMRGALRRLHLLWTPGSVPLSTIATSVAGTATAGKGDSSTSSVPAKTTVPSLSSRAPLPMEELEAKRGEEEDAFRLFAATVQFSVTVLGLTKPVLPELVSLLQLVLKDLPAFFSNEWVSALGFEPMAQPTFVRAALAKLRTTLGILLHPSIAPINLSHVDLSIPDTLLFAPPGGTAAGEEDVAAAQAQHGFGFVASSTNATASSTAMAPPPPPATLPLGALREAAPLGSAIKVKQDVPSAASPPTTATGKGTATTTAPQQPVAATTTATTPAQNDTSAAVADDDDIPSIVDSDDDQ